MRSKVVIVSLRFNPAFLQFLSAYAKAVRALEAEAAFLLDESYMRFPELARVAPVFSIECLHEQNWTHAIFLNPSVRNREAATALQQRGTKILYVFHEPWQFSPHYLRVEGLVATLKGILAHRATVPVLKLADIVMIPSQCGLKVYEQRDARFNPRAVYMPLIMDDEAASDVAEYVPQKRYFGFIGALNRSHGFDQYLAFMRRMLRQKRDVRFLVASRHPFPKGIAEESIFRRNPEMIEIRCGRVLNSEEMNRCYADCFCVWNLYRRSTQSAVLPKAFMFGTPVVASRLGSFLEYVQEGVTGRFADAEDTDQIRNAVADIRSNLAKYSVNCRRSFRNTFYYESQLPVLGRLIS